jgi:hypothetical protein
MDSSDETRRSMKDALSDEARRFLAPERKYSRENTGLTEATSVPDQPPHSTPTNPPEKEPPPSTTTRRSSPSLSVVIPAIVSMTFRLPASLAGRLLGVATERKLARERPFTQQDIISEALRQWLMRNGYGDGGR